MDVLPPEIARWQFVEERARSVLDAFAFREVRTAGTVAGAYVAHRRWQHEPVTRWFQLGEALAGAVFGVGGAAGEAELVAMLAAIAGEGSSSGPLVAVASRAPDLRERLAGLGVAHEAAAPLLEARLDGEVTARFEVLPPGGGPAVCVGERRDGLVTSLGGPAVPALTFSVRTAALVEALGEPPESFEPTLALFVATAGGEAATGRAAAVAHRLRMAGIRTEVEHRGDRSLADQRGRAAAARARLVLVVGERGDLSLEDLASGAAETLPEEQVEAIVRVRMD